MPYRYLLTCPSIVAVCCAGFASYWGLALGLTWFTSYLVDGLGFSQTMGGNLTILPWIFGMFVVLGGGWFSQRLKKAGVSSRLCRGAFAAATVTLGGCMLPFVGVHADARAQDRPAWSSAPPIGSTIFVVMPMIVSELTPQPQRAAMLAITTSIVTFAGVIAPFAMGASCSTPPRRQAGYEQGYVILGGAAAGRRHHRPALHPARSRPQAAGGACRRRRPLQPARA